MRGRAIPARPRPVNPRRSRRGLGMTETLMALAILALVVGLALEATRDWLRGRAADGAAQAVALMTDRVGRYHTGVAAERLTGLADGVWTDMEDPQGDAALVAAIGSMQGLFRREVAAGADCPAGAWVLAGGAVPVIARRIDRGPERGAMRVRLAVRTAAPGCAPDAILDPPSLAADLPGITLWHRGPGRTAPAALTAPEEFAGATLPEPDHLIALVEVARCDASAFREPPVGGDADTPVAERVFPESHDVAETPGGGCVFVPRPGWVADTQFARPVLVPGTNPPEYGIEAGLRGCPKRTAAGQAREDQLVAALRAEDPDARFAALDGCPPAGP